MDGELFLVQWDILMYGGTVTCIISRQLSSLGLVPTFNGGWCT